MTVRPLLTFIFMLYNPFVWGGYTFDSTMINDGDIDLSLINEGLQLPGKYYVSVYINGEIVDKQYIDFSLKETENKRMLMPCLSMEQLADYGLNIKKYSESLRNSGECSKLMAIPQAEVSFNFTQQRLSITVPQQALLPKIKEIAPEALWNDGESALIMDYQLNSQITKYKTRNEEARYNYVKLQPGINIGGWRLRSSAHWQKKHGWQRSYLYTERGLNKIRSKILFGESYSSGFFFDNIPFTGGKITSDESMLPHDYWSYAPVIRGVARTQAKVEVKQNGYVISNKVVPPGNFELTDISSSGNQGTMTVTVYENDGSRQHFYVPYNTPAIAVRQGYLGYNILTGKYRTAYKNMKNFTINMLEIKYGLPFDFSFYSGVQSSDKYIAGGFGIGAMLGEYGATSTDMIINQSKPYHSEVVKKGRRVKVNYNKSFDSIYVNMTNEFISKNFETLTDTLDTYNSDNRLGSLYWNDRLKNKIQLNTGMQIKTVGTLNFTGELHKYRYSRNQSFSYGASYSTILRNNTSMNLGWTKSIRYFNKFKRQTENLVNLWLSIPLVRENHTSTYASIQTMHSTLNGNEHEAGLYGHLSDNQFWWNILERRSTGKIMHHNSGTLNAIYRGIYGEAWGGYTRSSNTSQLSGRLSGKVVLTKEGLTAGQDYGDTIALVKVPGASDLSVGYLPGVRTDFRGYALVGAMNAYKKNTIDINPIDLPENVSLIQTSVSVIPTKGAVVIAPFRTLKGERVLLTLMRKDKKTVPFGSVVTIVKGKGSTGIVGENGEVYLSGVPLISVVKVRWGNKPEQSCQTIITLTEKTKKKGMHYLTSLCS
ncbi:fimbria/pilus outer membrane usher protein [Escherichia coli]|nr:fimbria/pilus outer membrane usher protein [Escherichia coli]